MAIWYTMVEWSSDIVEKLYKIACYDLVQLIPHELAKHYNYYNIEV